MFKRNFVIFLDLQRSVEKKPQIFDWMNCLGLRIRQRLHTISCFWYCLLYFVERFQNLLLSHFLKNLRPQFHNFFLLLKFHFSFWPKALHLHLFYIVSPGWENNHTFKCWSNFFQQSWHIWNFQNNISVYGCSQIQGTKFYSCWNLMKPGSQSETYVRCLVRSGFQANCLRRGNYEHIGIFPPLKTVSQSLPPRWICHQQCDRPHTGERGHLLS